MKVNISNYENTRSNQRTYRNKATARKRGAKIRRYKRIEARTGSRPDRVARSAGVVRVVII